MYKKYLTETETAADYTLVSQVMKGGVVYKVTWTTDREDIKVIADEANKQVTIDLNEKTKVDIAYKLTATITDPDGKTSTLTFELKVPKYVLSSWDEYMAMEAGKAVVVEGYIAAVHAPSEGNKYNTLYLHDVNNKGGYYIYSMADSKDLVKDLGLKKGMLVSVTGTKDIYSGTHEIKDASVNVLDTNVVDLTPLDITATYKAATSLKDKALTDKLGMLVTIKGVEITDQDLAEKSMYMNFRLAGLTSYLRVYATDCPASVTDKGQQSIITEHGKKKGYSADVTGVVVMYSGAIYLNPVSDTPFKYGKKIERTPAQMVELEMDEVKFDKDIALNKTIELPSKGNTYEDVVITWASNSDAIVIEDGKAKITLQSEATKASITGTFTLGTVVKTKTIEFNLAKKSSVVPQNAANPVPGVAYKFFYTHTGNGEYRYFDGTAGSYYINTSNDLNSAVDVYLEAANAQGYYYLYFMDGNTKKYIEAYVSDTGYCNSKISTAKPAVAFKLDASLENAPIINLTKNAQTGPLDYFLGTYGTNTDMRPSEYKYAAQGNYVAHLGTVVDANSIKPADKVAAEKEGLSIESDEFFVDAEIDLTTKGTIYDDVTITWASNNAAVVVNGSKLTITMPTASATATLTATLKCGTVTETKTFNITLTVVSTEAFAPVIAGNRPEAGKAYKLAMYQAKKGAWYYADGTDDGRYLKTTLNYDEGVDYYAELVGTDVYKFYILDGTTKKYLTVYTNSSNKDALKFDAAGTSTFTYDATKNAWISNLNGTDKYIGTYSTYTTFGASNASYINGTNTGVEQFPGHPVELKITETSLETNKAYKFALFQANSSVNKMYYMTGADDGRYLSSTDKPNEAADIYVEEVTGGFKFYILDGTTKKYLTAYKNSNSKDALKFDAASSSVFYFNGTVNAWVTNLNSAEVYMGTYSTYKTAGLSAISYIKEDNTGVSQFPLNLVDATFSVASTGDDNQGGGSVPAGSVAATFKFGTDNAAKTDESDQTQDGTDAGTSYSESNNGYTLSLTGMSKVYKDAYDGKGNACLKMGSSSVVGTFTFTVPADITSVKIYVTGYKAKTSKVSVNSGTAQTLTKSSANGEYDVITIDTSSNKTITFATVSGATRVKLNTIEFCK